MVMGEAYGLLESRPISFRRSSRLKVAPLVIAIAFAVAVLQPTFSVPAIAIAAYWLAASIAQFFKRIEVDNEEIRMFGFVGGPITIRKAELTSCRYVRAKPMMRGAIDILFLELRGSRGQAVRIWKYGWGSRQRRQLAQAIKEWLEGTSVQLDNDVNQFLAAMS